MTTHPLAPRTPRPDLYPGQAVHVNAHAAWLPATVISVTHSAVGISLATAGTPTRTVVPVGGPTRQRAPPRTGPPPPSRRQGRRRRRQRPHHRGRAVAGPRRMVGAHLRRRRTGRPARRRGAAAVRPHPRGHRQRGHAHPPRSTAPLTAAKRLPHPAAAGDAPPVRCGGLRGPPSHSRFVPGPESRAPPTRPRPPVNVRDPSPRTDVPCPTTTRQR
jgi:hypothetical protein